jgi:hypothetical protein
MVGNLGVPGPANNNPRFGVTLAGDDKYLYMTLEIAGPSPGTLKPLLLPATLYRIDPTTASARVIGSAPPFVPGSVYANGKLYGFSAAWTRRAARSWASGRIMRST